MIDDSLEMLGFEMEEEHEDEQGVKTNVIELKPQPGPQTIFLSSTADIAFYGGAAGGGKSYALLLEPLRHWENPLFGCVIFRRTTVQVKNEGGLWDESYNIYSQLGAKPNNSVLEWTFPQGARVKFAHLEHDKTVYNWQGSQIAMIGFDELTHFTENQFWYMISRNRSSSGVKGYIRGTTNPDADSWVRKMIDWYIDENGYAIPERSGVLRWFVRLENVLHWADTPEELVEQFGPESMPKSFTFVSSKLQDNKILMDKDPSYLANLRAQPRIDRLRLEGGNWDVRPSAGMFFQRNWFRVVDEIPKGWIRKIRYWDRAATLVSEKSPDPDWTRGLLLYEYRVKEDQSRFLIADIRSDRNTPLQIEKLVKTTAQHDGYDTIVGLEQDPGAAGIADIDNYVRLMSGFDVRVFVPTKNKVTRAKPVSAQVEFGNVDVLRAPWNEHFFKEVENFSGLDEEGSHDDQVDALSGAYNTLAQGMTMFDVI